MLWLDLFKNSIREYLNNLLIYAIVAKSSVYMVCTMVGIIYTLWIEPVLLTIALKGYNVTINKLNQLYHMINNIKSLLQ